MRGGNPRAAAYRRVAAGQGEKLPEEVAQHLWIRPIHTQRTAQPHTHKAYTNILTPPPPPAVPTLATTDVETGPKVGEERGRQAFSENVSKLRCRRNMKNMDIPNGDLIAKKAKINLNILGTLALNRIRGHVDDTNIVTIDQAATSQRRM
jgi:hypothetical protein